MVKLKQFIRSDFCLECFGCCRFAENPTIWAPSQCGLVKSNGGYSCANLNREDNRCKIYSQRPLDCQLYPFLLVRKGGSLHLGLHKSCYFIEKNPSIDDVKKYADYLRKKLNTRQFICALKENLRIAADYQENVEILTDLPQIAERLYLSPLNKLTFKDKPLLGQELKRVKTNISAYHLAAIFIWKGLFKILLATIEDNLCIFYKDSVGIFMALPPLGPFNTDAVNKCFEVMDFFNKNSEVSRIENVQENDVELYSKLGFRPKLKDTEYICLRKDLVELGGGRFKAKRSSCNYFSKKYKAKFSRYNQSLYKDCLRLYNLWMAMRKKEFKDNIYQQMLEDSRSSFGTALRSYKELGLLGYVVKVKGKIKACSFGYPLNQETFCIIFEVCDLGFKGIAQFIFREFCRKLSGYRYINIMGSSDLPNLKKVKLSYHPIKEVKVYNIYQ